MTRNRCDDAHLVLLFRCARGTKIVNGVHCSRGRFFRKGWIALPRIDSIDHYCAIMVIGFVRLKENGEPRVG